MIKKVARTLPKGLAFLSLLLALAACNPAQILYSDPLTRLVAPELVAAWEKSPWDTSRIHVSLDAEDAVAQIARDLGTRQPLPRVAVVPTALAEARIKSLRQSFPAVRFLRFRPESSATWPDLLAAAANDRSPNNRALALIPTSFPEPTRRALNAQWAAATGGQLEFVSRDQQTPQEAADLQERLRTEALDVFVLGGNTQVTLTFPANPALRVHAELNPEYLAGIAGYSLVPDVDGIAAKIDAALADNGSNWVESSWKAAKRKP